VSGIFGVYHINRQPIDSIDLDKMSQAIAHRGPDGTDIWVDGCVGLGHRMLWTTPESLIEKLPLENQRGDLVITADARIDNRDELVTVLNLPKRPIDKITDGEFILAAYEKWGESCPEYLLGDFAFVIWDKRKQQLFCVRDHLGVKPFYYYYQAGKNFLFASEMKGLFALPEVPHRLNELMLGYYLVALLEDKTSTSYQEILRLPPAHSMTISHSEIRHRCYWTLDPNREILLESDQAYADAFQQIFTEAVRCRLRSALPIASHLSGGLDSSSVTCVARKILAETGDTQLHTFSNVFDKVAECDERPFMNAVLEQGGLIPHFINGDKFSPLSELDRIWQYEEEAYTGPSHYIVWQMSKEVNKAGMRVVLDGLDGDNTVSHGGAKFVELARDGKWKTFFEEAKAVSQHFNTSPIELLNCYGIKYVTQLALQWRWIEFAKTVQQIHESFGISRKILWRNLGLIPVIPQPILKIWSRWRNKDNHKKLEISTRLVNSRFAKRIGLDERVRELDIWNQTPTSARNDHWHKLTSGIFAYVLERTDRYAAACSYEARHPFMDKRLIEFCLALPADQKLYQGWSRMVMRRGLANILPEKIQWRGGKTDMTPCFLNGIFSFDRQLLEKIMTSKLHIIQEYIDLDFLQAAYGRFISTEKVSESDIVTVWQAVILVLWFDHTKMTS